MWHIAIIGIGSGNPQHFTVEGVATLQYADVVIAIDKGEEKHDLLELRKEILATHSPDVPLVTVLDPPRDRKPVDYQAEVQRWHQARAEVVERAVVENTWLACSAGNAINTIKKISAAIASIKTTSMIVKPRSLICCFVNFCPVVFLFHFF